MQAIPGLTMKQQVRKGTELNTHRETTVGHWSGEGSCSRRENRNSLLPCSCLLFSAMTVCVKHASFHVLQIESIRARTFHDIFSFGRSRSYMIEFL
jgi:hypothetical protein